MRMLFYPTSINMGYIIDAIKILKKQNKKLKFGLIYSFNKKK